MHMGHVRDMVVKREVRRPSTFQRVEGSAEAHRVNLASEIKRRRRRRRRRRVLMPSTSLKKMLIAAAASNRDLY